MKLALRLQNSQHVVKFHLSMFIFVWQVYTVNILQLPVHIPIASLPQRFGGKMEVSHRDWIHKCLQTAWGKGAESEIGAYLEGMHSAPSTVSLASSMTASTVSADSGTLSEEPESDAGHKPKSCRVERDMDTSDDFSCSTPSSPTSPSVENHSLLGKRGAENEAIASRKKRSHSEEPTCEPSIHVPESGGFTVKELVDYCRIKGRNGLKRQYEAIKAEPPAGTFECSKWVYLFWWCGISCTERQPQ